jgi:hypothetical protein
MISEYFETQSRLNKLYGMRNSQTSMIAADMMGFEIGELESKRDFLFTKLDQATDGLLSKYNELEHMMYRCEEPKKTSISMQLKELFREMETKINGKS